MSWSGSAFTTSWRRKSSGSTPREGSSGSPARCRTACAWPKLKHTCEKYNMPFLWSEASYERQWKLRTIQRKRDDAIEPESGPAAIPERGELDDARMYLA